MSGLNRASANRKIGAVIRESLPAEKRPRLTPEQIEKLKTAGAIALVIVGLAGVIVLSAAAPNIFYALGKIFEKKYPNRKLTRQEKETKIAQAFYYLKKSRYITMRPTGKDFKLFLTEIGKKRLGRLSFDTMVIKKPRAWDGKWWQVAADIPTKEYKWAADLFRRKLKEMNFFSLQRTLWFYPHDPRQEIEFIIHHYGIENFVTVMEINRLDRDDEGKMRKYFKELNII